MLGLPFRSHVAIFKWSPCRSTKEADDLTRTNPFKMTWASLLTWTYWLYSTAECWNSTKMVCSNYDIKLNLVVRLLFWRSVKCGVSLHSNWWRCPWCDGYRHRIWTRRYEFNSWTRLIAFHIALIPLGKVWIQLFSLQLWVNSGAD